MPIACKYCVATKGLKGSDIGSLPKTDEEFADHMENVHHIPVMRQGETLRECMERFAKEQPEAGGPNCRCPDCARRRRDD